jgi:hypothetical protein
MNYPKEIRIDYCPYCGYSHIADNANAIDIDNFLCDIGRILHIEI